jgi:hypothetical protein
MVNSLRRFTDEQRHCFPPLRRCLLDWSGKSLLIFRNLVKPRIEKYSCFHLTQITGTPWSSRPAQEGRWPSSRTRGRVDIFNTFTSIGLGQAERTRWGGVIGVGLEYGFAPNWTAGIEYDYLFRESESRTFLTPNLGVASVTANTRSDISMITGRISYKFGGYGAPSY